MNEPTLDKDPAPEAVRLAEFSALREEIQNRSGLQQALVGLNLTAIATLGGLVLSNRASIQVLLVLPILSLTLGLMWIDHYRVIVELGGYIRKELWTWTPSWERHFAQSRKSRPAASFWIPVAIVWAGPSTATLGIEAASGHLHALWWLWGCEFVLLLLFAVFFRRFTLTL